MSSVLTKMYFGPILIDQTLLQEDWFGRQISWLAGSSVSQWALLDLWGFTLFKTSAIAMQSQADYQNSLCAVAGLGLGYCFHAVLKERIATTAFSLSVHRTWQRIFDATSSERSDRRSLFYSLPASFALNQEVLDAYLAGSPTDAPLKEIWFQESISRFINLVGSHQTGSNKMSGDAWGFALHVEEVIRLLNDPHKQQYGIALKLPDLPVAASRKITISKKRFLEVFKKSIPSYFNQNYSVLREVLINQVTMAGKKCPDPVFLFAAIALTRPSHVLENERLEDVLAYLYLLIYTNETDSLFEIKGAAKKIQEGKKGKLWAEEVFLRIKEAHPLELFFKYSVGKTNEEFNELAKLQNDIKNDCKNLNSFLQFKEIERLYQLIPVDQDWEIIT